MIKVIDNFFSDPNSVRSEAVGRQYGEIEHHGVTYPDICADISPQWREEAKARIEAEIGSTILPKISFLRLTTEDTKNPPHWAHTDTIISNHVAFIYLSKDSDCQGGTALLKHKSGMDSQPVTEEEEALWRRDTNNREAWKVVDVAKMKFNRCTVMDCRKFHGAMPEGGFGKGTSDGRLVMITFFDKPGEKIDLRPATELDSIELTNMFMEFAAEHNFEDFGLTVNPMSWHAYIQNQIMNNPMFGIVVATDGTAIIGACGVEIAPSWLDQSQLVANERFWFMRPKYRGHRVAIKMLKLAESWAVDAGAEVLNFVALESSPGGVRRYYEKNGYKPMETHFFKEVK